MTGSQVVKRAVRTVVPLPIRQRLAIWLGGRRWLAARHWWVAELLRDLAERDPDAYHRFLWSHHLGYAETYEIPRRFGAANIHQTRHLLFADLHAHLWGRGVDPARGIRSVFEVGCSMGYLLRFIETDVFPGAETLAGIDIDRYAIRSGSAWLRAQGSKVQIAAADMAHLSAVLGERRFDVILCAGVLMYLQRAAAAEVVRVMLRHAGRVVALAGLAHPERDNGELDESDVRRRDGTFIHNFDAMVRQGGGRVLARRWEGARMVDGNTVYFVLAEAI
jgi:SAM-dependent methyltransferase